MKVIKQVLTLVMVLCAVCVHSQDYLLYSPDKKIAVNITASAHLSWSARYNDEVILLPSAVAYRFTTSYKYLFRDTLLASVKDTVGMPVYLSTQKGTKLVLTEADLHDYPNLFATDTGKTSITAAFPPFVLKAGAGMGPMSAPAETAGYIARTNGKRSYPWRVLIIPMHNMSIIL